jgi:ferredoxin-nitrate reductase
MKAASRDSIGDIWGARTPYQGQWPSREDQLTLAEPDRWVSSVCLLCSTGCALEIGVQRGRMVGVRGITTDRVNRGRLGPKGMLGWQANHHADRLTHPMIRRGGHLVPAEWDEAMSLVVARTSEVRRRYGPGALGFYNSGQLCLEEYYTLAVIGHVGIGTPHMDGNTRLCTATAALALIESFGTDGNPGSYADFDTTEAILLFGHNMPETQTVLWARVLDRRRGPKAPRLVVIDPRRTAGRRGGGRALGTAAGNERPADQRPSASDHSGRTNRQAIPRRSHRRL